MNRQEETKFALNKISLYVANAKKAANSEHWFNVNEFCNSIIYAAKEILGFDKKSRSKKYRVRKNFKKYSRRSRVSRSRKSRRGKR